MARLAPRPSQLLPFPAGDRCACRDAARAARSLALHARPVGGSLCGFKAPTTSACRIIKCARVWCQSCCAQTAATTTTRLANVPPRVDVANRHVGECLQGSRWSREVCEECTPNEPRRRGGQACVCVGKAQPIITHLGGAMMHLAPFARAQVVLCRASPHNAPVDGCQARPQLSTRFRATQHHGKDGLLPSVWLSKAPFELQ